MFFALSKLLSFLLAPLTWIVACFLISFFLKNENTKKKLRIISIISLLFFSNAFIFDEVVRQWEIPATNDSLIAPGCYAAIVPGSAITYDPSADRMQFGRKNDRLIQAMLLYRNGLIKKIVFTGGSGSIQNSTESEAILAKAFLLGCSIPDSDIVTENNSRNTIENALLVKSKLDSLLQKAGISPGDNTFLLITSGVHMRRCAACFRKAGITIMPYSADRYSGPRKFLFDHLFIPNAETLFNWEILIHEITGYFMYVLMGYV